MTIKDWKDLLEEYPDEMPVEIITFRGTDEIDSWGPVPEVVDVEDVSTIERLSPDEKSKYKLLQILVG